MDSNILNPAIPFIGTIPNGLQPGRVIVIQGFIPFGGTNFRIDLCMQPDIAFHVSPRFHEGCVVRNSLLYGNWGNEERHPAGLGGLVQGQSFELMILTELSHYKLAISGRHLAEFMHRIPFQNVRTLEISGPVQVHRIEFRTNYTAPAYPVLPGFPPVICPSGPPLPAVISPTTLKPVYNPALPLSYPMFGGLSQGMVICFSGRPTNSPHRFNFDMACGSYPNADVGLHVSVRFDQYAVVRNSFINQNWGNEERGGIFPFQSAVNFDIVIRVNPGFFELTINGQYYGTFQHRVMPLSRIDFLKVCGDVVLSSVRFM